MSKESLNEIRKVIRRLIKEHVSLKEKRKKSKKKNKSLYPYVFNGYLDNDSTESDSLDFGGFNIEGE